MISRTEEAALAEASEAMRRDDDACRNAAGYKSLDLLRRPRRLFRDAETSDRAWVRCLQGDARAQLSRDAQAWRLPDLRVEGIWIAGGGSGSEAFRDATSNNRLGAHDVSITEEPPQFDNGTECEANERLTQRQQRDSTAAGNGEEHGYSASSKRPGEMDCPSIEECEKPQWI